jgi:ABC-type nitrate/sulfonate/bicarbonate transport system substrate-binding protein
MTKSKIEAASPLLMLAAALGLAAFPASAHAAELKPYRVGFNAWIGSIAFFVARE